MSDGGTKSIFKNSVLDSIGGYTPSNGNGFDKFTLLVENVNGYGGKSEYNENIFGSGGMKGGNGGNSGNLSESDLLNIFLGGKVSSSAVDAYIQELHGKGNDIAETMLNPTNSPQTGGMDVNDLLNIFVGGAKKQALTMNEVIGLFMN